MKCSKYVEGEEGGSSGCDVSDTPALFNALFKYFLEIGIDLRLSFPYYSQGFLLSNQDTVL